MTQKIESRGGGGGAGDNYGGVPKIDYVIFKQPGHAVNHTLHENGAR